MMPPLHVVSMVLHLKVSTPSILVPIKNTVTLSHSVTLPLGAEGFEPPKPKHLIYSQHPLAAWISSRKKTLVLFLTNGDVWDLNPYLSHSQCVALPVCQRHMGRQ